MANLNFQQISSLQQNILHLSEIILISWFGTQETFLIIINIDNSCATTTTKSFMENVIYFIHLLILSVYKVSSQSMVGLFSESSHTLQQAIPCVGAEGLLMITCFQIFQYEGNSWPGNWKTLFSNHSIIVWISGWEGAITAVCFEFSRKIKKNLSQIKLCRKIIMIWI